MRHAKEPRRRIRHGFTPAESSGRFDQRLLHHVFPVDDRSGHASAVTMQARAYFGYERGKIAFIHGRSNVGRGATPLTLSIPNATPLS